MRRGPLPSPWNRGPLLILSLAVFGVIIVALRLAGRGWIGAVTGSLVLAGLLCTLLVLVGDWRRRHRSPLAAGRSRTGWALPRRSPIHGTQRWEQ